MPSTKTITVYKFSELSDKAKEHAKNKHAEAFGYAWADEAIESLLALANHFDGKLTKYSVDFFDCSGRDMASFDMPEMEEDEIKELLNQLGSYNAKTLRGDGDCKLTGYCGDEDAIDGFRQAWHKGERNLDLLMDAAFDSWLKAAQLDCKDQYSDEQFEENSEANNYQYLENGKLA